MVHSVLKSQQIGQHITTEGKPGQPNGGIKIASAASLLFCLSFVNNIYVCWERHEFEHLYDCLPCAYSIDCLCLTFCLIWRMAFPAFQQMLCY